MILFDGEKNPLRFVNLVVICQRRTTNMDLLFIISYLYKFKIDGFG